MQDALRKEIRAKEREVRACGEAECPGADFDSMPYLTAVIRLEALRFHPAVFNMFRQAEGDDTIPLSKSIITTSDKILHQLPMPKGQKIVASIASYNRNTDIFGADAQTFNPNRCLMILELQCFLAEFLNNFEFSLTPKSRRIRRESCIMTMAPTVEGEVEKGSDSVDNSNCILRKWRENDRCSVYSAYTPVSF
ncbi:cytochrome P450 [Desarmillaria ectypa]|nr:cytochrome P450 [Desarmillaria ectypa]